MIEKAALTEELKRIVIHKIYFSKNECYDKVSKSLIRIMEYCKKVTKDIGDEVCIAEKVEDRVSEVIAGMSGRWGKRTGGKKAGGRVSDRGATGDKIEKPINNKYEDGNCLQCKVCKSIRHMKESFKDKNKEDNRAGNNGEILWCISCDSKKHLLPNCQHCWENMVNYVDSDSSNDEDSLFSMATKKDAIYC